MQLWLVHAVAEYIHAIHHHIVLMPRNHTSSITAYLTICTTVGANKKLTKVWFGTVMVRSRHGRGAVHVWSWCGPGTVVVRSWFGNGAVSRYIPHTVLVRYCSVQCGSVLFSAVRYWYACSFAEPHLQLQVHVQYKKFYSYGGESLAWYSHCTPSCCNQMIQVRAHSIRTYGNPARSLQLWRGMRILAG